MPEYEVNDKDRAIVESMIAVGIPQEEVATVIGIDPKTLRKYYRAELDTAATKANTNVAKSLYEKAKSGDTTAMIWWTKARMKWSGEQTIHHTGISISVEDKEDADV